MGGPNEKLDGPLKLQFPLDSMRAPRRNGRSLTAISVVKVLACLFYTAVLRWSPPPVDSRNPKRVISTLPASGEGIGHLTEGGRIDGRGKGGWATGTLTQWMKCNSGSCYFMTIFSPAHRGPVDILSSQFSTNCLNASPQPEQYGREAEYSRRWELAADGILICL
ncbi:hypothetical protein EVAR_7358_1 [Eumeta japonica]|uniref:Uncharacterized protein n=1 Tax=Eumeta variegata TaxID=151549 RepID=A0A4C1T2S1_EUMVA|nr:hypothetical protein EVAR_7358_1 [Eumeta japonica]